jgi:hypothetical protein
MRATEEPVSTPGATRHASHRTRRRARSRPGPPASRAPAHSSSARRTRPSTHSRSCSRVRPGRGRWGVERVAGRGCVLLLLGRCCCSVLGESLRQRMRSAWTSPHQQQAPAVSSLLMRPPPPPGPARPAAVWWEESGQGGGQGCGTREGALAFDAAQLLTPGVCFAISLRRALTAGMMVLSGVSRESCMVLNRVEASARCVCQRPA